MHRVKKVEVPNVPLSMFADSTSFKIYLSDVGIFRKMAKISSNFMFDRDTDYDIFRWAIAVNYVLNELIASTNDTPYYWKSENKAEVDFLVQMYDTAVPIEVKAGDNRSKSLAEFRKRYHPKTAVTISAKNDRNGGPIRLPLYAVWKICDRIRDRLQTEK